MAFLFLARHGETAWNAAHRLTGTADISINKQGRAQAELLASSLQHAELSAVYTSALKRTHQTFAVIQKHLGLSQLQPTSLTQLNERDCGVYTGTYKATLNIDELERLDTGWNYAPPKGESLAMVYNRVVPAFQAHILPQLSRGQNVLIVSHYNPMRLLKAYLEHAPEHQRGQYRVSNGELAVYDMRSLT